MKAICVHYSEERKDCIIGRFKINRRQEKWQRK